MQTQKVNFAEIGDKPDHDLAIGAMSQIFTLKHSPAFK